jgi:hypothetical protein
MKCVDANEAEIEIGVGSQKFSQRLSGNIAATAERDVRVPRAEIGFYAGGERCFLNTFVDLEQMRVPFTDADPNYFRGALRRKRADAGDRQKKRAKLDPAKFFAEGKIDNFGDVPEEPEREVHLVALAPADAAHMRVEIDKRGAHSVGQRDCDEETLGHRQQTSNAQRPASNA